ncbi:WD40 repeat-like protein [Sparassis crispa]|uniref:WD40 repeat-like protein n=1 Tax=Sparassis crispa TaxID=139825 RepID=A0A401G674_9APHY|nr:WD40 repeat-like protein [Sparassis crispa]GBE77654.1 WD40 repeat-like protein [Sparassis crispa]
MTDSLIVTAEEINRLIHAYFVDSGFQHSAYVLSKEAQLEKSPCFRKHVPYGTLVDLLGKALQYVETEAHWRGDALTRNCTSGFSLIDKHICALDPTLPETVTLEEIAPPLGEEQLPPPPQTNGNAEPAVKRKASTPTPDDVPMEKRARTEPLEDNMDLDSIASSSDGRTTNAKASTSRAIASQRSNASRAPRLSVSSDDLADSQAATLLRGHKTEVFVCAWNPANKNLLASGSRDAIVHIWDLPLPKQDSVAHLHPPHTPVTFAYYPKPEQGDLTSLDWSPDGTLLAIGSYDAILRVCNASGEQYFANSQHEGPIFAVSFSKSGRWILTASLDGTACVWDVKGKKLHQQFKCHPVGCLDIDWITADTFATCGADGTIQIRTLSQTPQQVAASKSQLLGHENEVNQIRCNPSGTRLGSCSDDRTTRIWNIEDIAHGHQPNDVRDVMILTGHTDYVSTLAWCPVTRPGEHEIIATTSFDGTTRLWDSVTGDCLQVFQDHLDQVYTMAFSPDGRFLASAGNDGWLHIYDVKTRTRRWSWFAGTERPGIFEIDWQLAGKTSRLAMALQSQQVGVIDLTHVPCLL